MTDRYKNNLVYHQNEQDTLNNFIFNSKPLTEMSNVNRTFEDIAGQTELKGFQGVLKC